MDYLQIHYFFYSLFMPTYKIRSNISPSQETKIELKEPVSYRSPSGVTSTINTDDKFEIIVEMQIEAFNNEQASEIATIELNRLSDVLSWNYDMGIIYLGISSITTEGNTGSPNTVINEQLIICDAVQVTKANSVKNLKLLSKKLEQNLDINHEGVSLEEALYMWREALKEQSKGLRFFLLFRILEWINDGKRTLADLWIRGKEPDEPLRVSNRQTVTVYTYLRDNVHAKSAEFPYKEIDEHLPKLQRLAKMAIKERFNF